MPSLSVSVNQSNLRPKVNTKKHIISVDKVQAAIIICIIAVPIRRRLYYIISRIIAKTRRRLAYLFWSTPNPSSSSKLAKCTITNHRNKNKWIYSIQCDVTQTTYTPTSYRYLANQSSMSLCASLASSTACSSFSSYLTVQPCLTPVKILAKLFSCNYNSNPHVKHQYFVLHTSSDSLVNTTSNLHEPR